MISAIQALVPEVHDEDGVAKNMYNFMQDVRAGRFKAFKIA